MAVNLYVPSRYDELVHRLALGVEPIDALTGARVATPLEVSIDPQDATLSRRGRAIDRHRSSRFVVRYAKDIASPIVLRLDDPTRRYVPRRIRFSFASEAQMAALDQLGIPVSAERRVRRPVLFAGAAHPLVARATGLRGRVTRGGQPVRWARIQARVPASGVPIGRAHGDDRGEFLLVLGTDSGNLAELRSPFAVEVTAIGPDPDPPAPPAEAPDQVADLPLEVAPAPGLPDEVSSGNSLPSAHVPGRRATREMDLPLGRVTSVLAPFDLP